MSGENHAQFFGFRPGSAVAGYRLEAQVGVGGMAVVFRARDERLDRLVALKILAPVLASDPGFRSRFVAESRAAAAVDDPFIIPVYEAGEAGGVLFIAMRFVPGGDLHRVLGREGALAPDRATGFVSPVASALDAAHRAGLVHRDVKPGNILVDTGEDRPDHVYLSDFGVSKTISAAAAGLTGPGHFVGTPDYSAPEQIQGRGVDGRADQYALGCVAFQLLTGTLPFRGDQGMPALLEHLSVPPPSAAGRVPGLPAAVDLVLARAMAKVPEKRYPSCLDFAAALRDALGLAPYDPQGPAIPQPAAAEVLASAAATDTASRRGGTARRGTIAARIRRHRLPALAASCAILAAALAIPLVLANPANSLSRADSARPTVSARPASSPSYLPSGIQLPSADAGRRVSSLAFSPSGGTLAIADSYLCLWDIAAGSCTTSAIFMTEHAVAFNPGGAILAVGDEAGNTYLWNVDARKPIATVTDPGSKGVSQVAFGPGGKTLATGDGNGRTYLWDVATGELIATLTDPGSKGVSQVAFSSGGNTLAAGDFDGRTYLWNTATRRLTAVVTDPGGQSVNSVALSPDGTLATGDFNGHIYLWNVAKGRLAATLTDPNSLGVEAVAFSSDGKTLAVGDGNSRSYLWNAVTERLIATLTDPNSLGVEAVAFSPDGKTLATGDESGTVWLWPIG